MKRPTRAGALAGLIALVGVATVGASASADEPTPQPTITSVQSEQPFVRITTMCQIPPDAPEGAQAVIGGVVVPGNPGDYIWRIRQEETVKSVKKVDGVVTEIISTTYDYEPVSFLTTHTPPITGTFTADTRVFYGARAQTGGFSVKVLEEGVNVNAYKGTASSPNRQTCALVVPDSTIVVRVFDDANNDGDDNDDVDSGLKSARVEISGGSLAAPVVRTTGPKGFVTIRDVAPGEYQIDVVDLPAPSTFDRDPLPIDGVNAANKKKVFTDRDSIAVDPTWFQDRTNGTNQAWVRFSTVAPQVVKDGTTLEAGGSQGTGTLTCFEGDTAGNCAEQTSQFVFKSINDGTTFILEPIDGEKTQLINYLATLTFFGAGDVTLVGAPDINADPEDLLPVNLCLGDRANDGLVENEYCLLNKDVDGDTGDATFKIVFAGDPRFSFR